MASARPEVQDPPVQQAPVLVPTETGLELEAALPRLDVPTDRRSKAAPASLAGHTPTSSLDEPSGAFVSAAPPPPGTPVENPASGNAEIDAGFEHMLATVRANRPADDLDLIRRAWAFCIAQHAEQKRASGEPYIVHP